jgi:hypothetical protein
VLLPAHDHGSMAIATGQLAVVGVWYILLRRRINGKASRTRDGDNETDSTSGLFELFSHIYKLAVSLHWHHGIKHC